MNSEQYLRHRIEQLKRVAYRQARLLTFYRTEYGVPHKSYRPYRAPRRKMPTSVDPFVWLQWSFSKGLDLLELGITWFADAMFVMLGWAANKLLKYVERKIPQMVHWFEVGMKWLADALFVAFVWVGNRVLRFLERHIPHWWGTFRTVIYEVS